MDDFLCLHFSYKKRNISLILSKSKLKMQNQPSGSEAPFNAIREFFQDYYIKVDHNIQEKV
jgi:hypothetical protein